MSSYEVQQIMRRLDDFERRVIAGLETRVRALELASEPDIKARVRRLELWRAYLAGAVAALTLIASTALALHALYQ